MSRRVTNWDRTKTHTTVSADFPRGGASLKLQGALSRWEKTGGCRVKARWKRVPTGYVKRLTVSCLEEAKEDVIRLFLEHAAGKVETTSYTTYVKQETVWE